ncbi:MAG: amidohydrolase family protein [Anaerohalosphaera sp.]|nr:amidohydrolase family protein [Anaerohalosphaera sp.]
MRDGIIDFHTHAFPDAIADRAMAALLADTQDVTAYLDGRVSSLLASMDSCGIEKSVICNIATKPSQFEPIIKWSQQIRSDRIIPFPSIHPDDPDYADRLKQIRTEGFKGIKMHPFYQDFNLDEDRMLPIYQAISDNGLILVMHTGYDIAFPRIERAEPARVVNVIGQFPELKLITTHSGGWQMWDQVRQLLLGKPVYMDISYSLDDLGPENAKFILENHPPEYLLFATDSPWKDQATEIKSVISLGLSKKLQNLLFKENAIRLLKTGI